VITSALATKKPPKLSTKLPEYSIKHVVCIFFDNQLIEFFRIIFNTNYISPGVCKILSCRSILLTLSWEVLTTYSKCSKGFAQERPCTRYGRSDKDEPTRSGSGIFGKVSHRGLVVTTFFPSQEAEMNNNVWSLWFVWYWPVLQRPNNCWSAYPDQPVSITWIYT